MALVLADRVRETTTTTGTGSVTLAGAYTGFQTFSAGVGNANSTYYTIANVSTGEYEVGIGTYSSGGNLLSRTTVLSSSNGGSLVNFSAGTKDAFVTQPAERALYVASAGTGLESQVTAFTNGGIVYASSTSALATGSALTWSGTALAVTGTLSSSGNATVGSAGGTVTLTIGSTAVTGAGFINLVTSNAFKNWQIASNQYVQGLSFTPSTAAGGTTYTTPVLNILDTGVNVTGTLSATAGTSVATSSGFLTVGTVSATGMNASDIGIPNNKYLRGTVAAGTSSVALIGLDPSNIVQINANGSSGGTTVTGALSATGDVSLGSGGTGTTTALLTINGGSGTGGRSRINFNTNGVGKNYVATAGAILGSTSEDLTLWSASANVTVAASNAIMATFSSTGLAVTGKISVSGTNPSIQQTVQNSQIDLCGGTTVGTDPAIQIVGSTATLDPNKIFYNSNTHVFRTSSGGSTYATIDTSGNLGIGTSSPFGTAANRICLSVNGTTDASINVGSGGVQRAYLYGTASLGQIGTIGALPLVFAPNDTERARIDSSGNLLVGTTTNASGTPKVAVNGSIQTVWGQFRVATVFDNSFRQGLYFDSTARNMNIFSTTSDSGGNILFSTRNAAGSSDADYGTERARISAAGVFSTTLGATIQGLTVGLGAGAVATNTAVGKNALAGNVGGLEQVAVGQDALFTNQSGNYNTAVGLGALKLNLSGSDNTALGYLALLQSTASNNTAVGSGAGYNNTSGANNTLIGYQAGYAFSSTLTGSNNLFLGYQSGFYVTSGSNNVIIGTYSGSAAPISATGSNYIVLSDGAANVRAYWTNTGTCVIPQIYSDTTANAANMQVDSGGVLRRSTSALKYKQDIRNIEAIDINLLRGVRYKSKCEGDDQTKDHFGIVADEVDAAGLKELVTYGADGEVEGFQYERLTVVLLKAMQTLKAEVDSLKSQLNGA